MKNIHLFSCSFPPVKEWLYHSSSLDLIPNLSTCAQNKPHVPQETYIINFCHHFPCIFKLLSTVFHCPLNMFKNPAHETHTPFSLDLNHYMQLSFTAKFLELSIIFISSLPTYPSNCFQILKLLVMTCAQLNAKVFSSSSKIETPFLTSKIQCSPGFPISPLLSLPNSPSPQLNHTLSRSIAHISCLVPDWNQESPG